MQEQEAKSVIEALLFASAEPLEERDLQTHIGADVHVHDILVGLQADYAGRGVRVEKSGNAWAFRTAPEVAPFLERVDNRPRRLGRAALETLSIVAYRQPVTRAEIEAVRGVPVAKGTLDTLVESGWVAPRGRRDAPGRPITWVTTPAFLDDFALSGLEDLPRLDELEAAGLFKASGN